MKYLSLADAIELHRRMMDFTGQPFQGLRDEGALDSALNRPQMAAYYEDADLITQAVLLAIGISQAQAFVDGNKRTAYHCCDVFLRINGFFYDGDPIELSKQLEAVAENTEDREAAVAGFEAWLRDNISPLA